MRIPKELPLVALIVALGGFLAWTQGERGEMAVEAGVSRALADEALDSATVWRERLAAAKSQDSVRMVAMEDSLEASREASRAARETADEARKTAAVASFDLRMTLDSAQTVLLDSIEVAHVVELTAITTERDEAERRASLWKSSDESARGLVTLAEAENERQRVAIERLLAADAAKDAMIRSANRKKVGWQIGAGTLVALGLANQLGLFQ